MDIGFNTDHGVICSVNAMAWIHVIRQANGLWLQDSIPFSFEEYYSNVSCNVLMNDTVMFTFQEPASSISLVQLYKIADRNLTKMFEFEGNW